MIYIKLFSLISVSVAFLLLVAWVYLPRNKARFDQYGSIPLIDEDSSTTAVENRSERNE